MAKLPSLTCPMCQSHVESDEFTPNQNGVASRASGFASCLRRCVACDVGFSNANSDDLRRLTLIYRDPLNGMNEWLRSQCRETIAEALNVDHRLAKWKEFASENSEDRVTWIVFRMLQRAALLREAFAAANAVGPTGPEPTLLLWGVPVPNDDRNGHGVRQQLISIADALGENPDYRSEPDVVADFGDEGVVIVEVKYRSQNDDKLASFGGWRRYLDRTNVFSDTGEICRSGLYELARNWRIGCELAQRRPFTLFNLGLPSLMDKRDVERVRRFESALYCQKGRQFRFLTWTQFLSQPRLPDELRQYGERIGLLTPGLRAVATQSG